MREQWRQHRDSLGCSVQRALAPDVRLKPLPAHRRPLVELDHMIQRFGAAREVGHVGVQCCQGHRVRGWLLVHQPCQPCTPMQE